MSLIQGLCEINVGCVCQVQFKRLENVHFCGDKSGRIRVYNQILLASYFRLQNHCTSHLAFCPAEVHPGISRIPRATSHMLITAVPASSVMSC